MIIKMIIACTQSEQMLLSNALSAFITLPYHTLITPLMPTGIEIAITHRDYSDLLGCQ